MAIEAPLPVEDPNLPAPPAPATPDSPVLPEDTGRISVDPISAPEPFTVSLDTNASTATMSEETATNRAWKFEFGLKEILKKSKDEIYQTLHNGDEDTLRGSAASDIDARKREETQKVLAEVAGRKGGDLSEEEIQKLTQLLNEMNEQTDPGVVLEQGYAKQLVAELDRAAERNGSFLKEARAASPEKVLEMENAATDFASKRMVAQTVVENLQDEIKQQGWGGYAFDLVKTAIPGYTDAQLRGNVEGIGIIEGVGLGANLEAQRARLYDLPTAGAFKTEFKKIIDNLKSGWLGGNHQIALDFARSMVGMSSSDVMMKNITLGIDFAGTGLASGAARGVRAGVKGTNVLMRDTAKAFKDIAEAGTAPNASKSTILEGAGDLKEAAVVKSTVNLSDDITGRPRATERAIESLTSAMRTDLDDFKKGSTNASRDLVNRVEENSETMLRKVVEAAETFKKVDRIPDVLSRETAVRAIIDDIPNMYPTLKNNVLDVEKLYKEEVSSNLLADMRIGKNDGTYFLSREVAENFIEHHKLGGVEILPGTDAARKPKVYYIPESAVKTDAGTINPGFTQLVKEGKPKFFLDENYLSEVESSLTPQKGWLPVTVSGDEVKGFKTEIGKPVVTVEQQGLGFYVKMTVPVPENSSLMRSLIAETGYTKLPDSPMKNFLTSVFGKLRSPESVLSVAERANRQTAVYGVNSYFNILKDNVSEISKLRAGRFSKNRDRWNEWQRMVEYADTKIDPQSTKPGYFYKDAQELTTDWVQVLGRLPDEQEIAAYFEFKRGMEIDRMFRNIASVRNQQRVGAMTNRVVVKDEAGKEILSPEFSGVSRRDLPGGDGNILIMGSKIGEEKIVNLKKLRSEGPDGKNDLKSKITKGEGQLVEIYEPRSRPFKGFGSVGEQRIQYVYSETIATRPLDWNQVPRRGGGHLQYDYDQYIQQANIRRSDVEGDVSHWYEGPTTIMGIQFNSQGKDLAKKLDAVRLKFKANDEAGAAIAAKQLPIDWDVVKKWFLGSKGKNFSPPMLNLNEPIEVVNRGQSLAKSAEQRYTSFKDGTRQNTLAGQHQIEFSQERDSFGLLGLEDIGSAGKPLYQVGPAKTVDPITTMQRGLQRIIKSNYYDDYKIMSVEHWLKQAGPHLAASPNEIKYSPQYYYNEAKFAPSAPADLVKRLQIAKYQIDQIVGIPSENHNLLYQYSQQVADYIYQMIGPKAQNITPDWLLPKLKDPFAAVRSFVFHPIMGLYNIAQFAVQMGGYGNIYGIAGAKYAAPGSLAAQFHFWTRANSHPNIIKHLDELAVKAKFPGASNWKPGEFTEAFNELHKTGFGLVGKEAAIVDDVMNVKVIENNYDKFLDMGTMFFRGGEENVRHGAWYTAYREFRDKNPFGRITERDRADILQRADLLNLNMSRASATALNKGVFSVPMQFYAYQQRLLSLFFSDRISWKERGRLLAWNGAMYGLPMTVGVTGVPAVDNLRQYALDNGYVVGDSFWKSMFMEGLPSAIGALATGKGDPQAGTWYDIGPRFGNKGLEPVTSIWGTDKTTADLIGGASYSFAKSTIQSSKGIYRAIASLARSDDDDVFKTTVEDWVGPLRQIGIVNSAYRIYAAAAFGRWMSKNEAYLTEGSPAQATVMALIGVKDQDINDLQSKRNSLKSQEEYEKVIEKEFNLYFHRGALAHRDGNNEEGKQSLTNAKVLLQMGNFREDRINSLVGKAVDDNRSILEKINNDYYLRKIPNNMTEDKADAYKRYLNVQEKKAQ